MTWHLTTALVAGCLLAADSADQAAQRDIEKWQGSWRVVSMENNGKVSLPDALEKIKLTVTGTDYHFQNGAHSERGMYKFYATKNPKEFDIVVGEGTSKGKIYLAIYKVESDELTICLTTKNDSRPKEFTGKAGSGCILEVWRREKP